MEGKYHAASEHEMIFAFSLAVLVLLVCVGRKWKINKKISEIFVILLTACIAIAAFYALWHSEPVVAWRNQMGGLFVSFQIDRFYWLYPLLWYLLLGLTVYIVWKYIPVKYLGTVIAVMMLCVSFGYVYRESAVKVNAEAAFSGNDIRTTGYTTWKTFFSENLFADIREYIGQNPAEYRVASIGLYPSIALYNGFYCIDGYSNNYDVNYKHEFRQIIAAELDKNESLRTYFDDWGNRCYLFVDQIPKSYQVTKDDQTVLTEINLNTGQLAAMGCEYLLSALPIDSPYMCDGLEFCAVFEDEDSPYAIYLYRVLD